MVIIARKRKQLHEKRVKCRSHYRKKNLKYLEEWSAKNFPLEEPAKFIEVAEDEILALHEGNFARYRLRPSEFDAWGKVWNPGSK